MSSTELEQALAAIEPYKSQLSAYTIADIISSLNSISDADWAYYESTMQSYIAYTGVDVSAYTTKAQILAYYKQFPRSYTLYDMVVDQLTEAYGGSSGGSSSGSSDPGEAIVGTDDPETLSGGTGGDTITGAAGDDTIAAGDGKDVVYGGDGNDDIDAGTGNDSVYGGAGNDILDGGTGADRMEGGTGADSYYVDNKKDVVYEADNQLESSSGLVLNVDLASNVDTVIASVKYTLGNYVENLTLSGSAKLTGAGNSLDNTLIGNAGANKITGMAGDDVIDGGAGADKLSGGDGADTFVFSYMPTNAKDIDAISDFTDADTLEFDTSVFTSLAGATSTNFVIGKVAADADDFLIYDNGKLYYDADGNGSGAAVLIAGIKGTDAKTLTFDDLSFS